PRRLLPAGSEAPSRQRRITAGDGSDQRSPRTLEAGVTAVTKRPARHGGTSPTAHTYRPHSRHHGGRAMARAKRKSPAPTGQNGQPNTAPSAGVTSLPTDQLRPNDYNPNQMTEQEFAELVAEVRHLGRLPKPVVVRAAGDGYQIVDGEHGWRAARQCGLSEVPCEVLDADDFEAMRQTYKRNQHGTHNPVLLGKMFRRMMEARGLSIRALAEEMVVSEGTVRNALEYDQAAGLRNSYAFEDLSVRQVRIFNRLPRKVVDLWLDSGADLKAIWGVKTAEEVDKVEVTYGNL